MAAICALRRCGTRPRPCLRRRKLPTVHACLQRHRSEQSDSAVAQADPNLALSQRIKLEYERDCFRRAEIRIRERLLKLQQAVAVTARAVKRAEQSRF